MSLQGPVQGVTESIRGQQVRQTPDAQTGKCARTHLVRILRVSLPRSRVDELLLGKLHEPD